MKTVEDATALEKLFRPLSRSLTVELAHALVNLQADEETQARYETLAEQRTQGSLTLPEHDELEAIVRANTLLGLLKAEARLVVNTPRPA